MRFRDDLIKEKVVELNSKTVIFIEIIKNLYFDHQR